MSTQLDRPPTGYRLIDSNQTASPEFERWLNQLYAYIINLENEFDNLKQRLSVLEE
jgi:hypothetical protein